ncbi:hypothetical protein RJ639_035003 [Escallonia herrerae]|uniref:Uncharacterized protein n=1 Tax=Escallonia herrerae TaxID=1293975 RepID=A0AA88WQR4_9ASTE|nr:hypothetical protein RJ639_035003 [Escallonia herrerae]
MESDSLLLSISFYGAKELSSDVEFAIPGVEMIGFQNEKSRNLENPYPGCLGRVVNLFDLGTSLAGDRLLTDKPHRDGSPLSRSQSDVSRMSPIGDQMEDKVIVSKLKGTASNRKSNGTPIKMLIAQEMTKEVQSKHNPPGVVAKLMGLDALPREQPDSASQRSHSRGSSRSHSCIPLGYWEQEHEFLDTQGQHEIHQYPEQNGYKDVYEIWQQSQKMNCGREKSSQKGRCNEATTEKKMALVRQKFMEAKRLATDEKLRQSKQFQDALEVLSSNRDLFLKFLQEPNSLYPPHLYELQPIHPFPETKRITVLRPSKMVDNNKFAVSGKNYEKETKNTTLVNQVNGWDKTIPCFSPRTANCKLDDPPTQPTRIVVLKPSPGKPHNIKAVTSPPSSSPRTLHGEGYYGDPEDSEARETREVAKEITRQMRENLSGHRRDETLLSSVFSNGYIGDESSFHKSENDYAAGNLSDSEVMSPASRHSWDYINRFGSPYSSSSFSRVSYSPESSVCREAKKRLSERWAMMVSNGSCQEPRYVRRSSSTLGEMLALSDIKKPVRSEEEVINEQQGARGSTSCLTTDLNKDDVSNSPRNLVRSKSVPVSSTVYGARLNVEVLDREVGKTDFPKDVAKARSGKSSFKGKVSSLFFSRNKKSSKEKPSQSKDGPQSAGVHAHSTSKSVDDRSQCDAKVGLEEGLSPCLPPKAASPDSIGFGSKQDITLHEAGFSVTRPLAPGIASENQDQPSPISVLEPPFEDDHTAIQFSSIKSNQHGAELPVHAIKSNLIDKSPPIGSIARTLSWGDSCVETATQYPSQPSAVPLGSKEEQGEWLFFVQRLLSAAGIDGEVQCVSFFDRWHSPDSPLDPSLRDKYVDVNDKETLQEGKRRQRKSTRKLVFDCVNAALVDIAGYGSGTCQRAIPCSGPKEMLQDQSSTAVVDQAWSLMKEWFSGDVRCVSSDGGDNNSLVVERVVRKEVVGKGWAEHLRLEIDNLGKEIEGKLLEEIVQEAVVQLTGKP